MAILWFGKATKLEDLKPKDLEKEKLVQQVQYDQLLARQRRASEEFDALLYASEPGMTDSEKDIAAYKMSRAEKRRGKAEADMQEVISRMDVLDSTLDVLTRKRELERKGIWEKINRMDADQLQQQLENLAIERKKGQLNIEKISEVLDVDQLDVRTKRSAGWRRARELIESKVVEKPSD
jgi:hypothetical protein